MKQKTTYILILLLLTVISALPQSPSGTFMDTRDGQTYNRVQIGCQIWMAENFRCHELHRIKENIKQ
ncbi:MAG: hypothetical protein JXB49_31410 [Bacteroidales bacterium]|nr:hypothetical protein [Bacteroidales bacterium]